jgi:hypothetical protein
VLRPSLEGLVIASSLPDQPENITFSMKLSIEEPSNKLVILGSVAGVLATSVLLVALYAPTLHLKRVSPLAAVAARCRLGSHASAVMQLRAHEARHREGQGHRGCGAEGRGQDGMGPRYRGVRLRWRHGHLRRDSRGRAEPDLQGGRGGDHHAGACRTPMLGVPTVYGNALLCRGGQMLPGV